VVALVSRLYLDDGDVRQERSEITRDRREWWSGRWIGAEIVAWEFGIEIDSVRMQAIIAGRWDPQTWKVWMP